MRRAQIKETDEGKEVSEDRKLVKEYRKAKKERTKGKATQGFMKLAKARPMCTEVPTAMMCRGEETQEQGRWMGEIHEALSNRSKGTDDQELEKRRRVRGLEEVQRQERMEGGGISVTPFSLLEARAAANQIRCSKSW